MSGLRRFRWPWFSVGLLIGAAGTGALVAAAADLIAELPTWRVLAALSLSAILGLADIAGRCALTGPRRQTYSGAPAFAGVRAGHAIWGIDLGLGFTTYRSSRLYWSGLIMLAVGPETTFCYVGTAGYAVAFLWSIRHNRDAPPEEARMIRSRRLAGVIGTVIAVALMPVAARG